MVIEIDKNFADHTSLNSPFGDRSSVFGQQIAIVNELLADVDRASLEQTSMGERFESLFRAHGGTEYAFKQIAVDVLNRNLAQDSDQATSPVVDGKLAAATTALRLERERIIKQLSAGARSLEKLLAFDQSLQGSGETGAAPSEINRS